VDGKLALGIFGLVVNGMDREAYGPYRSTWSSKLEGGMVRITPDFDTIDQAVPQFVVYFGIGRASFSLHVLSQSQNSTNTGVSRYYACMQRIGMKMRP
jgi:hypothetical protein